MSKSFRDRLAALERLEGQHYAAEYPGDLTVDDCEMLLRQIGMSNIELQNNRVSRRWTIGNLAALDLALARCNALLAVHPAPPIDVDHLAYGLDRYVQEHAHEEL